MNTARMHRVSHAATVDVPLELAFGYIDTFGNVPKFLYGVKTFTSVGPSEPRLGTVIEARMQLGPVKFTVGGEVAEHTANEVITVRLNKGPITGAGKWRFERAGEKSTLMNVEVAYQISGGLTGRALAKIIDSIIGPAIAYTERNLRNQLEAVYAATH